MDLFDNTILCKDCGKNMKQISLEKDGFRLRALKCPSCSNQIFHPSDVEELKRFNSLKNRQFQVKLRLVGNSYTVSIPREIVNFMNDDENDLHSKINEHMTKQMETMEKFVTLAMEEANRISLMFNTDNNANNNAENSEPKKTRTIRIIKFKKSQ
jgi:DNA-directed RNA polymerase subunit RPC12/RpoP